MSEIRGSCEEVAVIDYGADKLRAKQDMRRAIRKCIVIYLYNGTGECIRYNNTCPVYPDSFDKCYGVDDYVKCNM